MTSEAALRAAIVAAARSLTSLGLNTGTSGNISARHDGRMLITPSAIPYDTMTPEMIAVMPLGDEDGRWSGPRKPSTEWRMHRDIFRARPDAKAVVHSHPTFGTALAVARRGIPACHYMLANFGGPIRCAGYATFGTQALSDLALDALRDRQACLLANHGVIVCGPDLAKAMWLAVELETLARQYWHSLLIGGPVLLTEAQITDAAHQFDGYGLAASD